MTYPLNRDIPGQMTDEELQRVITLAQSVPPGGIIVEVGCLYGLSAWHFARHSAPGVTVFCIDPWEREPWIIDLVEKPQQAPPFCREAFESYTADCNNIVMIQGYSPQIARGWNLPIDLYFEDAVHGNPVLRTNLDFWSARVKSGGIISGHDYTHHHPDVISEADALSIKFGGALTTVGTLWSLRKQPERPANNSSLVERGAPLRPIKSWVRAMRARAKAFRSPLAP